MNAWQIEAWLREDGEPGAAVAWRGWCAQLEAPPKLAVAARDPALAARVAAELDAAGIHARALAVEQDPGPGTQERLFGSHAVVWVTSATAALGADERELLERLAALGAPGQRAVAIADLALLTRLSDDPAAEAAEVRARVGRLASWPAIDDVTAWFALVSAGSRLPELAAAVLGDEVRRAEADVARADAEIANFTALAALEDARMAEALADAERTAAQLRGGARRQLEAVRADLGAMLVALEQALPAELEAMTDPEEIRRVLPHWLQHVIGRWLTDRLAEADRALRDDLAGIVSAEDLARLQLVLPAVHPGPVRGEAEWTSRIGATLAIGGGATMVLFGLWVPGLAVVAGGMAWSALGQAGRGEATRARLLDSAVGSLRALGAELPAALYAQLSAIEAELTVAPAPSSLRAQLEERRHTWIAARDAALARGLRWRERTA